MSQGKEETGEKKILKKGEVENVETEKKDLQKQEQGKQVKLKVDQREEREKKGRIVEKMT